MRTMEFWFDFASNYSYLSMMRIRRLAADAGVQVQLKPFLLGPIFKTQGWDTSPFVLQKTKGDYVWRDMVRQCAKYGLRWQQPSAFPRNGLLAARVALQGDDMPWLEEFCEQVMQANFADDREIGRPRVHRRPPRPPGRRQCGTDRGSGQRQLQGGVADAHCRCPGARHLRRPHLFRR